MNKSLLVGIIILVALLLAAGLYYYLIMIPAQYSIPLVNSGKNVNMAPMIPTITPPVIITNANGNVNQPPAQIPNVNVQIPPPINLNAAPIPAPKTWEVHIQNLAFIPATLTIKAGDTVKWINDDQPTHQVSGATFMSQPLNTGDTYSFTFVTAGSYPYHCLIHPFMTATINVQ